MSSDSNMRRSVEDELSEHGVWATNTVGISMRPLFKTHRDAVVVKAIDRDIKKYDVVLYKDSKERYILHRVIKLRPDIFVIRGDNKFVKEYVPRERVLAYMISFNRKGKHHTVDELGYKLYSRFWNFIYPLRFVMHKIRTVLGKIKKLFKHK